MTSARRHQIDEIDGDVAPLQKGGGHAVEHENQHHRLDQLIGAADRAVEEVAQEYVEQRHAHHDDERNGCEAKLRDAQPVEDVIGLL